MCMCYFDHRIYFKCSYHKENCCRQMDIFQCKNAPNFSTIFNISIQFYMDLFTTTKYIALFIKPQAKRINIATNSNAREKYSK